MAAPAADKSGLLTDELKDFALSLPSTTGFPKALFCALCNGLALDAWRLICCNKSICSGCQAKLGFPTSCPSCEHSPLEEDSCVPNKSTRKTVMAWLQKMKKKEEAKAAAQAATPAAEATPSASEEQQAAEAADKPVQSIEHVPKTGREGDDALVADSGESHEAAQADAAAPETTEESTQDEQRGRDASAVAKAGGPPSDADGLESGPNNMNGPNDPMHGANPMMGMNNMPFNFNNNPNFGGMGWNPMNGMPNMANNMMGSQAWNNNMDYNSMGMNGVPNGMFGFGGGMGMGMNDMSSMNMMNYGGGFNGWNGMGGVGYNGFNQFSGYNQSGAYPMNQLSKNNFSQNRFHANGGANPQRNNRKGSQGGHGPGSGFRQTSHSRPGSRSGPPQNRDGRSPDGTADVAPQTEVESEQATASAEPVQQGKEKTVDASDSATSPSAQAENLTGEMSQDSKSFTEVAGDHTAAMQSGGLNHIQTVDSMESGMPNYGQNMMGNGMHQAMPYGMMNQFSGQGMEVPYEQNMGYNKSFGPRGGFNTAYGAATVLTGEPRGVGVEGAPTGPRAMREGRPNTGFSSRANNARYNQSVSTPAPSVTSTREQVPRSPSRRGRSRSPQRDDSMRTKEKSVSRSRSRSRGGDDEASHRDDYRDRTRSPERDRGRSISPREEKDYEYRKDRRHHRSSRYDDYDERDDDYDDRYRDGRDSRGYRTRSTSVDSKYRSRRDREKHRSSRSHRDRSRDHRRRHRSRSRTPIAEEDYERDYAYSNGADQPLESSSRRKKDKYRERERERSRDRDRDRDRRDRKDRDYDREYEYEREKRRRRRERDADDERDYEDGKHRSSRRSRKERDRDRERERDDHEYEKEPLSASSGRAISPPLNAPTGPSADAGFSIRGKGRKESKSHMPPPQPPTGPRALQPPTGPAADRGGSRNHKRKSSASSVVPSAPSTPVVQDHYAAERERNARERDRHDRDNRDTTNNSLQSRASQRTSHTSRHPLSSKRSRDEFETSIVDSESVKAPSGPAAHRDKRTKSERADNPIANMLTQGLRKSAGKKERRGGAPKMEGDAERELERVEKERDDRRYSRG